MEKTGQTVCAVHGRDLRTERAIIRDPSREPHREQSVVDDEANADGYGETASVTRRLAQRLLGT
jgi:uncharacterized Zn finger protein (UPF0148 family)